MAVPLALLANMCSQRGRGLPAYWNPRFGFPVVHVLGSRRQAITDSAGCVEGAEFTATAGCAETPWPASAEESMRTPPKVRSVSNDWCRHPEVTHYTCDAGEDHSSQGVDSHKVSRTPTKQSPRTRPLSVASSVIGGKQEHHTVL